LKVLYAKSSKDYPALCGIIDTTISPTVEELYMKGNKNIKNISHLIKLKSCNKNGSSDSDSEIYLSNFTDSDSEIYFSNINLIDSSDGE